ncbi:MULTISPECIES: FRG domain-containing protein [unclassified Bosea (in: a-proteobacteria)]|uniref:FRG domain-containing protein n=1 Tax=unclassified Bosea (in: a-proteobacteria) TaxID=2653178 RepID=UPI000856277D|nr:MULTISPECIES: FRG domain-containing protein [unclassified Bosea (in: a-proteobacteria)]AOG04968.1 FRG domain protein [Bosea sp. RAC05]MDP3410843.1 FRG domain-containing protein [Bosea sp. (in: a-proteobacteria)]
MSENFNYIAFGAREMVEDPVGLIGMTRGRMFEYTPSDIAKRLENLEPSSIAFLESIPTFLCTEIERAKGSASMLIKYGVIENTTVSPKEVSTSFTTIIDFGDVTFSDIEAAREVFDASGFQLYRTHWAVRVGDANQILARLGEIKPELREAVQAQLAPNAAAILTEPPPRTKKIIGTADSVEQFLQILYSLAAKEDTETFFRGHENSQFELTPSLFRRRADGGWQFLPSEDRLCKELLIAHYDDFQSDQYCFDRLVRMQHYRLPTRLLDISSNPLVALFFACHSDPEPLDVDGEVIIFHVKEDNMKYYDSDTVSCISNISNLTYDQKNSLDLNLEVDIFNQTQSALKLLHHIKSEKGFFEARIAPDDLRSIICVKAKRNNTRIKSQSGAFLLFGHEATLPEYGQDGIEINRVSIQNKREILKQLNSLNINAMSVYPSIDQTAVHLRARYLASQGR